MTFSYIKVRRSYRLGEEISSEYWCREGWITKDRDSRSWLGGEGLPSRDHACQAEERERAEATTGGFERKKPEWSAKSYESFGTSFSYVCVSLSGDSRISTRFCWRIVAYTLGNVPVQGRTTTHALPSLCAMYISLSGPFSLLREPLFDLNKSILDLVFPLGFFPGVYTKKYWSLMCDILVS